MSFRFKFYNWAMEKQREDGEWPNPKMVMDWLHHNFPDEISKIPDEDHWHVSARDKQFVGIYLEKIKRLFR